MNTRSNPELAARLRAICARWSLNDAREAIPEAIRPPMHPRDWPISRQVSLQFLTSNAGLGEGQRKMLAIVKKRRALPKLKNRRRAAKKADPGPGYITFEELEEIEEFYQRRTRRQNEILARQKAKAAAIIQAAQPTASSSSSSSSSSPSSPSSPSSSTTSHDAGIMDAGQATSPPGISTPYSPPHPPAPAGQEPAQEEPRAAQPDATTTKPQGDPAAAPAEPVIKLEPVDEDEIPYFEPSASEYSPSDSEPESESDDE